VEKVAKLLNQHKLFLAEFRARASYVQTALINLREADKEGSAFRRAFYHCTLSVVRPERIPRTAGDPDDDVVIGTALASRADCIVIGDRDLLSGESYGGVRIVTVFEAIALVAQNY
jgi:predicted nucleic acid-binding protein